MKTKLLLVMAATIALPLIGVAADEPQSDQSSQNPEINKLVAEMNNAPADQKLGAVVTLLNKLVQQQKTEVTQTQQTPATTKEKSMCMCCDMMKHD